MAVAFDSRADTVAHIELVRGLLGEVIEELRRRGEVHDASKLEEPEKSAFDKFTPRLAEVEYGSDEYRACLDEMRPALEHHYANNSSHHPDALPRGIYSMSLLGWVEMIADWFAAGKRHGDGGDIVRSIEINQERFDYDDDLKRAFIKTAEQLGWTDES